MKKRTEKIKEIERLIEKNKGSKCEFISSFGKIVAMGAIATISISSFVACEKVVFDEKNDSEMKNKMVKYPDGDAENIDSLLLNDPCNYCEINIHVPCNYCFLPITHLGGSGS